MSLKKKIISFTTSQGADLVGIAGASVYTDYIQEVSARLQETGAEGRDYVLQSVNFLFFCMFFMRRFP